MVLLALIFPAVAAAQGVGTVTHLSGTLSALRGDGSRVLLSTQSEVAAGDLLITAQNTYARVKFIDGAEVVLRPNSQLKVEQYDYVEQEPEADGVLLRMLKGGLRKVTGMVGKRNRERVKLSSPTATLGVRGTHFGVLLCQGDCAGFPTVTGRPLPDGLHVDVVVGAISLDNAGGSQVVSAGEFAYVNDSVTPPVLVPPTEGVRVTMPPAISRNDTGGRTLDQNKREDQCVVQ
jgi:hypothetical protein